MEGSSASAATPATPTTALASQKSASPPQQQQQGAKDWRSASSAGTGGMYGGSSSYAEDTESPFGDSSMDYGSGKQQSNSAPLPKQHEEDYNAFAPSKAL